jgi:UDP-N-acetylglucosamine:LPS N-acetylglucosamine transferase
VRLVLAGGGTFGHVGPLLATAHELRQRDPYVEIQVIGTAEGIEAGLVPAAGWPLVTIPKAPLPRRPGSYAVRFPALWRKAMSQVKELLTDFSPDAALGFGGYVATPVYRVARSCGVPYVVHEANARPGLANRMGARAAAAVGVALPDTQLPGAQLVGMPLRAGLAYLNRPEQQAGARAALGLHPDRPTLLVAGGSLGAARLNQTVVQLAPALLGAGAQVVHLAGPTKAAAVMDQLVAQGLRPLAVAPGQAAEAGPAQDGPEIELLPPSAGDEAAADGLAGGDGSGIGQLGSAFGLTGGGDGAPVYRVIEYLDAMELALAAADLAVERAGAGSVAELACAALPSVLVPLAIGNGEQRFNAAQLVGAGGAELVLDAEFETWAGANLLELLLDTDRLAAMTEAAASVAIRDGAERLADLVSGVAE